MALDLEDKSPYTHNLTNNNSVAEITSSLASITGNISAARFSAGSSRYFSASITSDLKPTGSFTVEFWAKFSDAGTFDYNIFQSGGIDNTASFYNGIDIRGAGGTAGKVQFIIGRNGSGDTALSANTAINDGSWHHVACSWDGSTMRIYIDGNSTADNSTSTSSAPVYSGSARFELGSRTRDDGTRETYYNGDLDEIRFWNVARSGADIAANYNKQLTGEESGLIGYWPLNTIPASFIPGIVQFI